MVEHSDHGTRDAAGRSASTNSMGDTIHLGRDGLAGQSGGVVGPQRLSAQARKEKKKSF
jgi:hypothetical protein